MHRRKYRRFTNEEISFLTETIPGKGYAETASLFNERFHPPITPKNVRYFCHDRKIKTGRTGGTTPYNTMPIGSERLSKGRVMVKTEKGWKFKHIAAWEGVHGRLPEKHVVLFADGNPRNFNIKNLLAVSVAEFCYAATSKLLSTNPALTLSAITTAKLVLKLSEINKKRSTLRVKNAF